MLHVDLPTRDEVEALIADRGLPRVSVYLPTTPITPDAQADRIALKNLTTEALAQLAERDVRERRAIEALLLDLVDDDEFWAFQAHGLAIFATPERLRTFRLPTRLTPAVEVSDRFHVKPLLRVLTVPQSAFVLALSQNAARLVEVSPDLPAFEVKVPGMPSDAASAARKASIQGRAPSGRIQGSEGEKVRIAQFARKVDLALRDLLGGRETPLVLVAAEPVRSIFASLQSHPHLELPAASTNPERLSDAELASLARGVLDERFRAELAELHALFAQRANQGRTTTDVAQAARAATHGAIQKLLVDIDAEMPGTVADDGAIALADGPSAASYGVLDEIAARALLTGARVLGVRRADIPGEASLAAILRYPA